MITHFTSYEHRWLSNFWPCEIIFEGVTYRSVEHAYMSAKSDDPEWKLFCLNTEKPADVKYKSKEIELRPDWDDIKVKVMRKCVTEKFTQEPFKTMLLETGTEHIQEGNWWGDRFWGVDLNVSPPIGKNMLGILIMEVRNSMIMDDIL